MPRVHLTLRHGPYCLAKLPYMSSSDVHDNASAEQKKVNEVRSSLDNRVSERRHDDETVTMKPHRRATMMCNLNHFPTLSTVQ